MFILGKRKSTYRIALVSKVILSLNPVNQHALTSFDGQLSHLHREGLAETLTVNRYSTVIVTVSHDVHKVAPFELDAASGKKILYQLVREILINNI